MEDRTLRARHWRLKAEPPAGPATIGEHRLTTSERAVWQRILGQEWDAARAEAWRQMQVLFPRLVSYNEPPQPRPYSRRGPADTFVED